MKKNLFQIALGLSILLGVSFDMPKETNEVAENGNSLNEGIFIDKCGGARTSCTVTRPGPNGPIIVKSKKGLPSPY